MVAYIFSFIDRQILSLMIEPIKVDLQITDTQFSLLSGLAFSMFYALMGLPIAFLADRFSRVRIIALGVAFWSLATAACGLSKSFPQMFLARMSVGVGEAALTPATYSMLSDLFSREKLGRAVGLYSMGAFLGGGLAFLVGGLVISLLRGAPSVELWGLGEVRSWQLTFFIVGLPEVLVALLILATIRDPQRQPSAQAPRKAAMGDGLRFIGNHRPTFLCLYLGFAFFSMCQYALVSWSPALYMRQSAGSGLIHGGDHQPRGAAVPGAAGAGSPALPGQHGSASHCSRAARHGDPALNPFRAIAKAVAGNCLG